jgi:hypothetical protein
MIHGSIPSRGKRFSSVPNHKGRFLGPSNTLFTGCREVLKPEAMQLRHEVDHSPPSSAEVKNELGALCLQYVHRDRLQVYKRQQLVYYIRIQEQLRGWSSSLRVCKEVTNISL